MSKFDPDLVETAADWLVRLDEGMVDQDTFDHWLAQSDENAGVIAYLRGVYGEMGTALRSEGLTQPEVSTPEREDAIIGAVRAKSRFRQFFVGLTGIAAALAMGVFMFSRNDIAPNLEFETMIGEVETVSLSDGTQVFMNTDSLMRVSFQDDIRAVELLKGEAHFDVSSDPERPFTVTTNNHVVQAVGTAFAVSVDGDGLSVVVSEGRVLLDAVESAANTKSVGDANMEGSFKEQILKAGDIVEIVHRGATTISEVPSAEIQRRLAWRHGGLIFDHDRLDHVIGEIERYTGSDIVLMDPSLNDIEVGGYFRLEDANAMLGVLQANLGLEVRHSDSGVIEVYAAPE